MKNNSSPKTLKMKNIPAKKKKTEIPKDLTAKKFIETLKTFQSATELKKYHRFFTFDEKNPGKGDQFIGVRMGHVFALSKKFLELAPREIEKLLESPIHEIRAGGCSIMGQQATYKNTTPARRKELYDLYLRRHDRINHWDLVDLAAYKVVGRYLFEFEKSREILYKLARSKDTWERRSSIVSTFAFIAKGQVDDSFRIAEILLGDEQDLVHKAVGWAMREAGKKDPERLFDFLNKHAGTMPRVTLRASIERLDRKTKDFYMGRN